MLGALFGVSADSSAADGASPPRALSLVAVTSLGPDSASTVTRSPMRTTGSG